LAIGDWRLKRFFRTPKSDDTGLDGPEHNDEQNAELHERKGPELHGAKGNGSEKDQSDKKNFYKLVNHGSKFNAQG
jgi:hypothetical protein